MRSPPLVSVIMPCFNCEKFIGESIRSVLSQTYSKIELIVIDDLSTDRSILVVGEFKDSRIKLIRSNVKLYASGARRLGISCATGDFIAFCDSDDIWEPRKISIQLAALKKYNLKFICSWYYEINESDACIGCKFYRGRFVSRNALLYACVIGNLTAMLSSDLCRRVAYPSNLIQEDYIYWLSVFKYIRYAKVIQLPLARYRVRQGSLSSNKVKAAKSMFFIYFQRADIWVGDAVFFYFLYVVRGLLDKLARHRKFYNPKPCSK